VGISLPQTAHIYAKISQVDTPLETSTAVPRAHYSSSSSSSSQVRPNAVLGELLYHHNVATLYQ